MNISLVYFCLGRIQRTAMVLVKFKISCLVSLSHITHPLRFMKKSVQNNWRQNYVKKLFCHFLNTSSSPLRRSTGTESGMCLEEMADGRIINFHALPVYKIGNQLIKILKYIGFIVQEGEVKNIPSFIGFPRDSKEIR